MNDDQVTDLDKTIVGTSAQSSADIMDTTGETKDFGAEQTTVPETPAARKIAFQKPTTENKVEFRYETFFEFLPRMDYLAEGAMGAVFRAEDREFGRRVALKQVKSNRRVKLNDSIQSSFFLEGEVTGRLDHPGVLPMYGLGRTPDGLPFYAMKFIGSPKFTKLIDDFHEAEAQPDRDPGQSNQEFRNLLNHLRSACLTIQYAHDNGVLHCDIKPDNIMTGEYGETYVVDWGLALLVGPMQDGLMMHTTDTGTGTHPVSPRREESRAALHKDQGGSRDYIGGSPAYMSPEHHQSTADRKLADMSPACDVFSLGVTLYQILTGVVPVNAVASEEHHRRFFRMRMADYLPPRELKPAIPKALEAICLKAIAKEPKDRYESAKALADDLERWQAGEPVVAYPENWLERSRRWARRNRTAVSAIAATLLVVTFFSLLTAGLLGRKNAELAEKNNQIEKQNEEIRAERNRA
ncbi:MAG: serine/threonine protein kinase, partial [bacterium]